MSNSEVLDDSLEPEEDPVPPSILPEPDQFRTDEVTVKKNQTSDRKHPKDPYQPLRKKRKGCGGCCGCLALLGFIFLLASAGLAWFCLGPAANSGYEFVILKDAETTLSKAPERSTLYLGRKVTYAAPLTDVEIEIIAQEIHVSGDFQKNVSLRGLRVFASKGSRFAENLEVYGAKFSDEGTAVNGKLKGKILNTSH